jgi:lipid-binding SYLF domain-containing protein
VHACRPEGDTLQCTLLPLCETCTSLSDGVARADSAQLLPLDLLRRARGIAVISVARAGLVWGAAVGRCVTRRTCNVQ